jgi:hypothetical protein
VTQSVCLVTPCVQCCSVTGCNWSWVTASTNTGVNNQIASTTGDTGDSTVILGFVGEDILRPGIAQYLCTVCIRCYTDGPAGAAALSGHLLCYLLQEEEGGRGKVVG